MKAIPKRTLLVTCIIILLPMFFGLALWNRLPERMPTHFDFSGTVDDYSDRPFAVIGLPLFILAMQLFCAVMLRRSQKAEYLREDGSAHPAGHLHGTAVPACNNSPESPGHDFCWNSRHGKAGRPDLHRHRQLSAQVPP